MRVEVRAGRAAMSLVRTWLIGIGAFAAVTAAFCIALVFAIAGPPSPAEMAGLQVVAADALHDLDGVGRRLSAAVCRRLPEEARGAPCVEARAPVAAPPPARVVLVVDEAPEAPPQVTPTVEITAAPIEPPRRAAATRRARLLGAGHATAARPRRAAHVQTHARPPARHARPIPTARTQRPPRTPAHPAPVVVRPVVQPVVQPRPPQPPAHAQAADAAPQTHVTPIGELADAPPPPAFETHPSDTTPAPEDGPGGPSDADDPGKK